jgi:uncharacterized protein
MLQISQLFLYPIKSMKGIPVSKARVTDRGFEYDRRWMLVDRDNRFISQRELPRMALLDLRLADDGIRVTCPGEHTSITVPFRPPENRSVAPGDTFTDPPGDAFTDVLIWDDTCRAQWVGGKADAWFTSVLGADCRLVFMPDETKRTTDPRYAPEGSVTSFADGYPFLLIGQASLDDLNSRLSQPLPMDRFRPNIVFTGGTPYLEDTLHKFVAGSAVSTGSAGNPSRITFRGVKLCARCVMTTIDQETAQKGKEPLKTLASYRFQNNKILFGQNLIHDGPGELSVGDELIIN